MHSVARSRTENPARRPKFRNKFATPLELVKKVEYLVQECHIRRDSQERYWEVEELHNYITLIRLLLLQKTFICNASLEVKEQPSVLRYLLHNSATGDKY